ncbi:MAG TPA: hypothetical protein VFV10_06445 [Gammaproteobacteria bacterium]|nr:hypothetical protein [Gammaproteobacteria bacterium]
MISDAMRGTVRCAFPLATLGAFSLLLFSEQGVDVLRALIEAATTADPDVLGLIFLGTASAVLSLSLWYTTRWLLTAEMPGLPLNAGPGTIRAFLPRFAGAVPPALVAVNSSLIARLDADVPNACCARPGYLTAAGFAVLAAAMFIAFQKRGALMGRLQRRGWLRPASGRAANNRPGVVEAGAPTPALTVRTMAWSVALTFLIGLMITLFPVTLPRVIGGASIAALALASINFFGSFALTYWPLRRGLPNLTPWVLVFAGAISFANDNHLVESARPRPGESSANAGKRLDVVRDFDAFVASLRADEHAPADTEVPVIFVASEGGGIRAAYWTAAVLEDMLAYLPDYDRHIYAVSGVSGGSLGLAGWLTERRSTVCTGQEPRVRATDSLGMDFLSPAVAGLFYYDLFQRFLPLPIRRLDRSRAIETAWERAFERAPDAPFSHTLADFYTGCGSGEREPRWLPRLLLNSTTVKTGKRAVLSPFDPNVPHRATDTSIDAAAADQDKPSHPGCAAATADVLFNDTFDAMNPHFRTRTQSLAGLVHHSARFPVVSPPGTVERVDGSPGVKSFRLVDGGYFDNSGVQTAIELIDTLCVHAYAAQPFKPLLLLIRNNASAGIAESTSGPFPEFWSVVGTLLAVRGSHAEHARLSVDRHISQAEVVSLRVSEHTVAARAPLGWVLSRQMRRAMEDDARCVAWDAARSLAAELKTTRMGNDLCKKAPSWN